MEHVYSAELLTWLQQRFGYSGSSADALAYFLALPVQQQGVFVRQVYYEELDASGKEFNDPSSERFKSYLRGQDAIASLFPTTDSAGNPITYTGDITLYSTAKGTTVQDSGVHTDFGGAIQILNPGGETHAGGAGRGAAWGGGGPPDPGCGRHRHLQRRQRAARTVTHPDHLRRRHRDLVGHWRHQRRPGLQDHGARDPAQPTLQRLRPGPRSPPTVPSTGAGIGTLNPIPQVPRGNINLIAPLGTVNAGEAGIRVSGNINVAALHVVNAANIQVQGTATGIPTTAAVNTGALSAASAASSAVTSLAEDLAKRAQPQPVPQDIPSIITVQVVGFGGGE